MLKLCGEIMARNFDSNYYENKCDNWRTYFIQLDDSDFLMTMRLYLSEVKTPYNKQKLLEQLEAFLRREETQKNIIALLSKEDILLLSAIKFLSGATIESLKELFGTDFIEEKMKRHLQELQSRLLIYEDSSSRKFDSTYKLNPILAQALDGVLTAQNLCPEYDSPIEIPPSRECARAELVAAFLSYVAKNKSICKLDGTFKKRAEDEMKEKFPGQLERLVLLSRAAKHLGLIQENEGAFELNWNEIEAFAELEKCEQIMYLLAAIPVHYSKERTRLYAEIFLKALNAIPQNGFSESVFLRYIHLLCTKQSLEYVSYSRPSRFSKIVQSHEQSADFQNEPETLTDFFKCLVDYAETLGVINSSSGNTSEKVIFKNPNFFAACSDAQKQAMLETDSAFNVTLMQGCAPSNIVPLIKFADIVKFDTVAQFEINKDSVIRALDCGMDSENIIRFFQESSNLKLPEALEISLKEWEDAYKSISIYKGFIIKLDEKSAALAEHNSHLRQHIFEQLAPGIFLLDCADEAKVERLLKRCGIENAGKIKTAELKTEQSHFSKIGNSRALFDDAPSAKKIASEKPSEDGSEKKSAKNSSKQKKTHTTNDNSETQDSVLQNIFKSIDALELSDEQKDTLRDMAASKLIVSSSQLRAPTIPVEKKSARGMDYQGKLHIIEQALRNKEKILFRISKGANLEVGIPTSIERTKFQDGIYLNLIVNGEEKEYSVGRLEFVQRLHKKF